MFLFERLFGVSVYTYLLAMVCIVIAFTAINSKTVMRLYIAALCILAFFYEPYVTGDLYRIYETMDWYRTMELGYFVENYVVTSSVPVSRLFYWLVSQTGVYNLVPVISCLLSYSIIFGTIYKSQQIFSISRINVALTLFFVMTGSAYISVVGGIRMMSAMTLLVFCFFRESVEEKFRWYHIAFYAMAVLIHNMALIIMAIRLLAMLLNPNRTWGGRLLVVLLMVGVAVVMALRMQSLLLDVFENAKGYLTEDSYSDKWEYLMGILLVIFYGILCVRFRKAGGIATHKNMAEYHIGMLLGATVAVIFCFVFSIFYRLIGHLVPLLGIPLVMITLEDSSKKSPIRFNWLSTQGFVLLYGALILLLSCSRGSLSSLKFFVFH